MKKLTPAVFCFFLLLLAGSGIFYPSELHPEGALNINKATQKELILLPFINIKTSKSIVDYRKKHGSFENRKDILNIEGVPGHILDKLANYSKFSGSHTLRVENESFQCGPPVKLLKNRDFFHSLIEHIKRAGESIHLSTFIFVPRTTSGNKARKVADALIEADKRGVEVKVYLEKQSERTNNLMKWNRKTGDYLKEGGVEVFVDSPEEKNHFKAVLIDKRYLFLGSHNMTSSALSYNNELSVLVDSREFARSFLEYIETIDYYRY